MTLNILSGYNNYYNRLLKMEETIEEYIQKCDDYFQAYDINFNPNDNIHTDHIIGQGDFNGVGDYLVVTNDSNEIVSRWFIMESQRTRAGQYKLLLRRDVIADYYNIIVESPVFIEKSMLGYDSPLLFNKEDMAFNQIKSKEYLLKDASKCPWLVGYYAADAANLSGAARTNDNKNDYSIVHIGPSFDEWPYFKYTTLNPTQEMFLGPAENVRIYFGYSTSGTNSRLIEITSDGNVNYSAKLRQSDFDKLHELGIYYHYYFDDSVSLVAAKLKAGLKTHPNILGDIDSANTASHSAPELEHFIWFAENLLSDNNETRVYQPSIESVDEIQYRKFQLAKGNKYYGVSGRELVELIKTIGGTSRNTEPEIICRFQANGYKMTLKTAVSTEVSYDITANAGRLITADAPYNIFAMPYGNITAELYGGEKVYCEQITALQVASAMIVNHGGGSNPVIYDIQLLPYCPFPSLIKDGKIVFNSVNQYSVIAEPGENGEKKGVIINVPSSKIEFNIPFNIPIGATALERKVNNECDKWRLCSPNFADFFDFSVEMNYGVDFFNVDCEFKPYTPYIHVNPNFKNLYGADYNDPRGLVCGGDFSITQVASAWTSYQIQNKNYEKIFGRQMQNMEVQHKAQSFQTAANALVGTVSGLTSGIMGGSMMGGIPGGIAGGVVGTAASAFGGAVDYQVEKMLQKETLDYTQDMYNYQLDNIQALPQTISKISSFNNNNKIFPILEYYTCTDQEKNAFRNKIKYNGMTTMVIDTLENYTETPGAYIKGKLVRLEGINDDYHVVNIISEELNKGFFTPEIQTEGEQ